MRKNRAGHAQLVASIFMVAWQCVPFHRGNENSDMMVHGSEILDCFSGWFHGIWTKKETIFISPSHKGSWGGGMGPGRRPWDGSVSHCLPHPRDGRRACEGLQSSVAVHRLMRADATERWRTFGFCRVCACIRSWQDFLFHHVVPNGWDHRCEHCLLPLRGARPPPRNKRLHLKN